MGIKLIAIDMDGTWLKRDCTISKNTEAAIRRALDAGYLVVPATGRSYRNTSTILKNYRGLHYSINANGAILTDVWENRMIHEEAIPYKTAKAIYDLAKRQGCFMELYEGVEAYVDSAGMEFLRKTELSSAYVEQLLSTNIVTESLHEFMDDPARRIAKFHIICADGERRRKLQGEIAALENVYPISVFDLNIEATCGVWNKAMGLAKLAEYLGISRSEVMAIGDSNNDLDMLRWAGTSVAMGNAEAHIKELADYVTASNEEDGIVRALEHYL